MKSLFAIFCFVLCFALNAQEKGHEELGSVKWNRDYDEAVAKAKKQGKDILILFQEVPGCETCRNYGHDVLNNPLMVEAIQNSFIPLAIFNNLGGKDSRVLNQFNEASWNNPVVRIVKDNGDMIVPRIAEDYSAFTLCSRMVEALQKKGNGAPKYLTLLEESMRISSKNQKTMYYKVPCFWKGEQTFGDMEGVLSTSSGFSGGSEVVKVVYNSDLLTKEELKKRGDQNDYDLIDSKQIRFVESSEDLHYFLQNSDYAYLALTDIQKTRINSALGSGQSPITYLSPSQVKCLKLVKNSDQVYPILFRLSFTHAWELMKNTLNGRSD